MKARTVSLVVIVSVLLMAFAASPVGAGTKTTDYTGTASWGGIWNDLEPPVVRGGTVHELVYNPFQIDTTDPRVSGLYKMISKCTWPLNNEFAITPCQVTWTLDNDQDSQPEWEGIVTLTAGPYLDHWNGNGHGLGEYAGLKMSFKAYGMAAGTGQVVGQIVGD